MTKKTTPKARSRNTTVAVSPEVADKLDRFCRANNMTKKDFVSESLDYFLKEGINPKVHESPQAEIKKITKRIDQFFAFFKKQEQEFIKPLMLEIVQNEKERERNHKYLTGIIEEETRLSREKLLSALSEYYDMQKNDKEANSNKIERQISTSNEQIKIALEAIGEHLDPSNKKGLLDTLTNLFK